VGDVEVGHASGVTKRDSRWPLNRASDPFRAPFLFGGCGRRETAHQHGQVVEQLSQLVAGQVLESGEAMDGLDG
jgi:hypothetical protein